ncbi:MAG: hypothetical protein K6D94_11180 [Clostridiales bacterium]|nr:hypothetical protein [Clostridiales bacterium]
MSSEKPSFEALAAAAVLTVLLTGCVKELPPADTAAARAAAGDTAPAVTESAVEAGAPPSAPETVPDADAIPDEPEETPVEKTLKLSIADAEMPVTWQDNESVEALKELAADGLNIQMSMYGGFEQVGPLGKSLPRDDKQTTTGHGDIVLYSGDQIVVFYGSNSWSYTRLGHIGLSQQEMTDLLSNGDVVLTLKYE